MNGRFSRLELGLQPRQAQTTQDQLGTPIRTAEHDLQLATDAYQRGNFESALQLYTRALHGNRGWMGQRAAGTKPHWMGIYDDHNRLMVAMTFNNDVGDSWELADEPTYPERFSALGIRLGINYVIYSMTH